VTPDPRTPVLVGAGVAHQRFDDPAAAVEAIALMATAAQRAGADAGAPTLLGATGAVFVPRGTWTYADPGRLLAERFGAPARSVVADVGVLQQTLFTRACLAIAAGDLDVALVCGGEAKYRDLRARITGTAVHDTGQPDGTTPDDTLVPASEILPQPEIAAGLISAPLQYSVLETALRAAGGETVAENARATAELWAASSRVAAANPDAWRRDPVSAEFLEHPSPANPMLAAPYTKWHCSQWNVDQAAAFVLCSTDVADRHGVPEERRVYPLAAVESNHMVPISRRAALHRAPAVRAGAKRLAELGGYDPAAAEIVDLYSCFPAAVRIQARELGLPLDRLDDRPLTVGGGMTFAGGPLNNATFQALARMVEQLRAAPGTTGLLTCISGMITKHGMALWSTTPPDEGFRFGDVSAAAEAATPVLELTTGHRGSAVVDGYTVAHEHGEPRYAAAVATTPDGRRSVVRCDDPAVAADMAADEWCGRAVTVDGDRFTRPA
jgi:acetyl-CoA C-acetyltransferase